MKRTALIFALMLLAAAVAAQNPGQTTKGGTQSSAPQTGAPAQQQPPAQQPGATAGQPSAPAGQAGAQGQPGAAGQPAAPAGKRPLQAKSNEELAAYKAAAGAADPNAAETAANEFAEKFPDSELKAALYQSVMQKYQAANNADKVIEVGRRVLQAEPDNAIAAVMVATVLSERTRESDLDKAERLTEARKDADIALKNVDNIAIPANVPPQQAQGAKNTVVSMAYAALGTAAIVDDDYATAEQNLKKAIELPGITPDALTLLRLSLAQDHQQKYAEALATANKAAAAAQDPQVQALVKQEQERLQKLQGTGKPAQPAPAPKP